MQVLVLGSAAIVDRDRTHALGSVRQATVLALLALNAGRPVSTGCLVDALWGESPPATARNTLQVHVSALRRLLGTEAIEGGRDSYRYVGAPSEVDALRFAELARRGSEVAGERPMDAARLLRSALSLYRGDLLAGVTTFPDLEAQRERLRRLYVTAQLARIDADIALGRHLLLIDELVELARQRPYDEEVVARQMLSLYRSGAQAEALQAYADLARRLRADLGIAPGPRAQSLQAQVLRHDPGLLATPGRASSWRLPLERPHDLFVGRDALLLRMESELGADRVHTLVGPSGTGKTRLATELAVRRQSMYPDGAVLVPLAGVKTAEEVMARLADALVAGSAGVPADPDDTLQIVADARALVVLDDLVATPQVCARLDELIACGHSTFVVTSARPAGLRRERIWSVPALDVEPAVELLLVRARYAGAELPDDMNTRRVARQCVDLLDRLPLAIELIAPLAVSGLPELVVLLSRGTPGGAATVSFTSSLERLGQEETELVDLLASARHPVDAELVDEAGLLPCLSPLVRDGMVVRSVGAHGSTVYSLVGALGTHVRRNRGPVRDRAAAAGLLSLLVTTTGSPRQTLPMQVSDPALRRRLVSLEPVLVEALDLARRHSRPQEGSDLALFLPELHYALHGGPPPVGRADWLLARDDLDPGRRIDLLVCEATTLVAHNRRDAAKAMFDEAISLARRRKDAGRLAVALAQLSMAQLLLSADLGADVETQREAVRLAEGTRDAEVIAATLCVIYPTEETPKDLVDALPRALAASRACGHAGLIMMALGNSAMAGLDRGDLMAAAVHARECAALAQEVHHRGLIPVMLEVAETAELLSGSRTSVLRIAQSVQESAANRDFRRLSESLLRLAAGLDRLGRRDEAARALGVYDALLVDAGTGASEAEAEFAARWLRGVPSTMPRFPVHESALELAREVVVETPALREPVGRNR